MLVKYLARLSQNCSNTSQPFLDFLANTESGLSSKRGTHRSVASDVFVTRNPVSRAEAISFMTKKNIVNKSVLLNIDQSHLIGMKRLLSKNYLEK
jgi:hypothetical protein